MSSPAANLRKPKRSPLPQNRSVPFRYSLPKSDGSNYLEENPLCSSGSRPSVMRSVDDHTILDHQAQRKIVDRGTKREQRNTKAKMANRSHGRTAPSDSDLVGTMASRLALVERELLASKREIIVKDSYISELEERIVVLERSVLVRDSRGESGEKMNEKQELELKCLTLQKQVDEMEEFLNDYGMIWVGGSDDSVSHSTPKTNQEKSGSDGLWMPVESVAKDREFVVDFDSIVKNVKELNALSGEGRTQVTTTPDNRAKLKPVDAIPLTLYKNGIVMFQGPFRPFTDATTRQCVQDLMDGYYPSELQSRFPDGVPFQLSDCRDVTFKQREYVDIFPGSGRQLGGMKGPSKLLPSGQQLGQSEVTSKEKVTSVLPGPKVSMENFLSKLPASVVRGGRVVDVRAGVADVLCGTSSKVTLVDTPALQEIKDRLDLSEDLRPPTPSHLTTLKIKSEVGDQMYLLKMKYSETIGDVKNLIKKLRSPGSPQSFHLKSNFPPRTFTKLTATLSECGLVPNANLFMARTAET